VTGLLVVMVGGARYGLPAAQVGAVLRVERVTRVPLTSPEILGLTHVRGKTLGLVHLARLFDVAAPPPGPHPIAVTIETPLESYAVIVDDVEDVIDVSRAERIETPGHVERRRAGVTAGLYRLDGEVIVALDVNRLFEPVSDGGASSLPPPQPQERRP
jgi:purine-binding chemotaxis protein CheW